MGSFKEHEKKVLLLEYAGYLVFPFLFYYLSRGYQVYYLEMAPKIWKLSLIRKSELKGSLKKITYCDFGLNSQLRINNQSIKEIEGIYDQEMKKNPVITNIERLYGSEMVHCALKKYLLYQTFNLNRLQFIVKNLQQVLFQGERILFIPGPTNRYLQTFRIYREFLRSDFVKVQPLALGILNFYYLLEKIGYLISILVFPVWILGKIRVPARKRSKIKNYHLGMRIYANDFAFSRHYQNIDFLVDGVRINKDSILFCPEERISPQYRQSLERRGYTCAFVDDALQRVSIPYLKDIVFNRFLRCWGSMVIHSFSEPAIVLRIWLESSMKYLKWTSFLEKYHINHYVVNNDLIPLNTLRNIIFSTQGITTWMFTHSCSNNDLITPPGDVDILEKNFSFFYYDRFVVWGQRMENYYTSHPNAIRNYQRTGCLWSEFIKKFGEIGGQSLLLNRAREQFIGRNGKVPCKIIAVFDTSFGYDCPLAHDDIILFIRDILALLSENKDIGIIFKNKFSIEEITQMEPKLLPSYNLLTDHPRVFLTGKEYPDSSEAIAVSDFVISVGFTSPTIEALGARRRAMYHDPSGTFRGFYYDRIPKFVSHSYNELKQYSQYWMNECTDGAFIIFLESYVKGDLDFYIDGLGITRFREALTGDFGIES